MHGNLFEWCADRFDRNYYRSSPVDDPLGPQSGTYRVIRGGDWYSDARDCRSAFRYADVPEGRFYALGFRVVCELASKSTPLLSGGAARPSALRIFSFSTSDVLRSARASSTGIGAF